ncbi:KEOPS complex subunit Pcc1 [Methanobacterium ferruginis]|jgi:KEOPS complex subunit Pcc1|uniref:KEOPS complex subunit Pcc1 n=1 Tax=Methanobacterium ferruginis TaxID=710191 RepID=UPI002573E55E|nr:KEOPS complex subunit Pcc1 [Methanobacterium ferruginis]BDZ68030.1 hypothetical protein GCM10025860_14780 [Methanobacterium ferruginis]
MTALRQAETQFEFEFPSQKDAEIVLLAVEPEITDSPSERTVTEIDCHHNILRINIKAQDTPSLRAALNSYLRWIILSQKVLELNNINHK